MRFFFRELRFCFWGCGVGHVVVGHVIVVVSGVYCEYGEDRRDVGWILILILSGAKIKQKES